MSSFVTGAVRSVGGKITRSGFDTRTSRPPASTVVASGAAISLRQALGVPRDRVRDVRLLERGDLLVAERELLGRERILEVRELGRADDRRGHPGPLQQPRQSDLRAWNTPRLRDLSQPVDHLKVNVELRVKQ